MIEIKNLSFGYQEPIFTNFSETIHKHTAVLLTGANAQGKSTLIALIGGVIKPSTGAITISGQDISQLNSREQGKLRSVAPQHRSFSLAFSVESVLNFVPEMLRAAHRDFVIDKLGLTELLHKKVTELSIGQKQRVSVALALIQEADFYLLDEPFSAQDMASQKAIIEVITELKKEKGVLVVSHNTDALHSSFDREIKL